MQQTLSTSVLLRAKLSLCTGPADAAFARLWADDQLNELVPSFLVLVHQIMRASVPLMECAVRRCEQLRADDPLGAPSLTITAITSRKSRITMCGHLRTCKQRGSTITPP